MARARKKSVRPGPLPQAATPAKAEARRWQAPVICLVLAAITFAVFGQTLQHEFIDYDDNVYVYENPAVASGLTFKGLVWAFTSGYADNWHPLTWISHMLDCQWYGLHPGGHHLTNVLLHTLTVVTLFLLLRQMTGALWRSTFVAAVFAIHPLRVESVAWVAERKDALSGLFLILTIAAYARYARRPRSPSGYALVVSVYALGLMCKPMLVTLPVVLLLLDYWPLQRVETAKKLVLEKLPLLALAGAVGLATLLVQKPAMQSTGSIPLALRLANALVSCLVYLDQLVFPANLVLPYPYPRAGFPAWEMAVAAAVLIGFSVLAWNLRRRQPWLLVGWAWYLIMLLPVLGIIQVGQQPHADRYTYLPQIGICIAVTWLVAEWRLNRAVLGGLMIGVLATLAICAWKQTSEWRDSETLWTHALACTTDNEAAHFNLSNTLLRKGRPQEAIAHLQTALRIKPDDEEARIDLGRAFSENKQFGEAITTFQDVLQANPHSVAAHCDLGLILVQTGKVGEAAAEFQTALQLDPGYAPAHNDMGNILFQDGKVDDAIGHFQKALEIDPNQAEAHYDLANALRAKDKMAEAMTHYEEALRINPDYADAHLNLGTALAQRGQEQEAAGQFQMALQLRPGDINAQNNLAWLLATSSQASLRNGAKAVELARQANALTGGRNPIVLHTLAAAFAENGQLGDAVSRVQEAIAAARAAGQSSLVKQFESELKRYEARLPIRR